MRGRSQKKKPGTEKVLIGTRLMSGFPVIHVTLRDELLYLQFDVILVPLYLRSGVAVSQTLQGQVSLGGHRHSPHLP